jgi:hypothetical protein
MYHAGGGREKGDLRWIFVEWGEGRPRIGRIIPRLNCQVEIRSHHSYASPDGKNFPGTSHFLISITLPIASAEPIATEKGIKNADRASTLGAIA